MSKQANGRAPGFHLPPEDDVSSSGSENQEEGQNPSESDPRLINNPSEGEDSDPGEDSGEDDGVEEPRGGPRPLPIAERRCLKLAKDL